MLTDAERRLCAEAARRYPAGHGWDYFCDKRGSQMDPGGVIRRLCLHPERSRKFG
jgi:hypothetical protein